MPSARLPFGDGKRDPSYAACTALRIQSFESFQDEKTIVITTIIIINEKYTRKIRLQTQCFIAPICLCGHTP